MKKAGERRMEIRRQDASRVFLKGQNYWNHPALLRPSLLYLFLCQKTSRFFKGSGGAAAPLTSAFIPASGEHVF